MQKYFFGIDVGTQGARVILIDQCGQEIASGIKKFDLDEKFREEQSPDLWWENCLEIIDQIIKKLPTDFDKKSILAVCVTSTSGTVIPLDQFNKPLYSAIMYSDGRSVKQGKCFREIALRYVDKGYTGFNASSGISKMLWYVDTFPEQVDNIAHWIYASDYIVGKLSGNYTTTDYTNVLKSAFDLEKLEWPTYIFEETNLKREWFGRVVPSGTVIGNLSQKLSIRWGISQIAVVVGLTDGCASQMASGAVNPGDWNTTIGTTLVIKGVTRNQVIDPLGRLYSHRHPDGYWMPGGASNTGADWISLDYSEENLEQLNAKVERLIPTQKIAWPLKQEGERYPLMALHARAIQPENLSKEELYAANLEGVAFIEKLAYELIEELSGESIYGVYTAGGGSNSDIWLRIRASVLNVPIYKCKEPSGALGAAIMAASNTFYTSTSEASKKMTSVEKIVEPDTKLVTAYKKQYQEFKNKLKELKYL